MSWFKKMRSAFRFGKKAIHNVSHYGRKVAHAVGQVAHGVNKYGDDVLTVAEHLPGGVGKKIKKYDGIAHGVVDAAGTVSKGAHIAEGVLKAVDMATGSRNTLEKNSN